MIYLQIKANLYVFIKYCVLFEKKLSIFYTLGPSVYVLLTLRGISLGVCTPDHQRAEVGIYKRNILRKKTLSTKKKVRFKKKERKHTFEQKKEKENKISTEK